MLHRNKVLITIVAACLGAAALALVAFVGFNDRFARLRPGTQAPPSSLPESQAPVQSPTDSGGGAIGPEGVGPSSQDPTYSPDGREIAFVTNRRGGPHIWIISVDGRRLRQITTDMNSPPIAESRFFEPAWSPDGSLIAFTSHAAGNFDIWVVGPNGSNLTRLTTDLARDTMPAWSPDGSQIAFVSNRLGSYDIWIMNADGTNPRRVLKTPVQSGANYPAFSPDGRQLVFTSTRSRGASLMIVNVDGTGLRQLTTGDFYDLYPRWSARGIVFESNRIRGSGGVSLWLIQPEGSGLQALPGAIGGSPAWSPDGTRIAFRRSERGDMSNIYEFNLIDGTIRPLTQLKGFPIAIDIMPGLFPNTISLRGAARIPVAILSAPGFDPTQRINQASVTFGPTGDERSPVFCTADEVNGDGVPDLICHFETALTDFRLGNIEGILRLMDVNRVRLEGRDSVVVVP